MGCSAAECLRNALEQVELLCGAADEVKSFLGRWRIIKFRLEMLRALLQEMSRSLPPSFLEDYPLCSEALGFILQAFREAASLAQRCILGCDGGKLRMQSDLDSLAARFNQHIWDCELLLRNSYTKELLISSALSSAGVNKEVLRWSVRDLLSRLQLGDLGSKAAALNSLLELLGRDRGHIEIVRSQGGVIALINLLDAGGGPEFREKAALAVRTVATAASSDCEGAIGALARLLDGGTALAKEHAAVALATLTSSVENAVSVAGCGGVPAVVRLCWDGTPDAQAAAAGCIRNLGAVEEIRRKIVDEEPLVVAALAGLLRSGTSSAKECAAAALYNLSARDGARVVARSLTKAPGAVEGLMRYVETSAAALAAAVAAAPDKSHHQAVTLLHNVACYGNGNGNGGKGKGEEEMKVVVGRKKMTLAAALMALLGNVKGQRKPAGLPFWIRRLVDNEASKCSNKTSRKFSSR